MLRELRVTRTDYKQTQTQWEVSNESRKLQDLLSVRESCLFVTEKFTMAILQKTLHVAIINCLL